MNTKDLVNVKNKLKEIRGETGIGMIVIAVFMTIMVFTGIAGGVIPAALIFGIIAVVCWSAIPRGMGKLAKTLAGLSQDEISRIEQDAAAAPVVGNAFVTRDAVVKKVPHGGEAIPAKDIIWIYAKETTQRAYGIAVGRSFSTQIMDRRGKIHELRATGAKTRKRKEGETRPTDAEIQTIYQVLHQSFPGIVYGYKPELAQLASKNLATFVQEVEKRNAAGR